MVAVSGQSSTSSQSNNAHSVGSSATPRRFVEEKRRARTAEREAVAVNAKTERSAGIAKGNTERQTGSARSESEGKLSYKKWPKSAYHSRKRKRRWFRRQTVLLPWPTCGQRRLKKPDQTELRRTLSWPASNTEEDTTLLVPTPSPAMPKHPVPATPGTPAERINTRP